MLRANVVLKRKKFTYQRVSGSPSHCFRHHLEIQEQSFQRVLGLTVEPGITWALWRLQRGCVASENPTELPAVRAGHPGEQLTYKSPWSHCSWSVQLFKNIHLGLEGRLFPPTTFTLDLQMPALGWFAEEADDMELSKEGRFQRGHRSCV